jgi:AAA15 family ATPase/GTPase
MSNTQNDKPQEATARTNAITRVEIKDFLVFKGEFTADFCPGVNVLIGGNGTGKTTLMKVMYALLNESDAISLFFANFTDKETISFTEATLEYTNISGDRYAHRTNAVGDLLPLSQDAFDTRGYAIYRVKNDHRLYSSSAEKNPINAVYIPTEDMLSHATSFLALDNERKVPFNQTHIDILAKAELGETRTIKPNATNVLNSIKAIIGGEVVYENDTFYVVKEDLGKVSFSLEASGFRKFGLLWKLLRNGLLESGSILFWDEPEASINPELIPTLVDILLELQRGGVQIFVATHSFDVARWIELNKQPENTLRYFNLRKESGRIVADVADNYETLPRSVIDEADDILLRRSVQAAAASAGVELK